VRLFDQPTNVAATRIGPEPRIQAVLTLRHVLVVVWGNQDTMMRLVDVARAEAGLPPRPTSTASAAMGGVRCIAVLTRGCDRLRGVQV